MNGSFNVTRENRTKVFFIIAGRKTSIDKYLRENPLQREEIWKRCRKKEDIDTVTVSDKIILLKGWWQYDSALVSKIKFISEYFPGIIEFFDGEFGKEWREKHWKSEEFYDRFDILDLG